MLTESTKKARDPLAFALLGATVLYLMASIALLFKSDAEFADKAALFSGHFLNPVWGLLVVAAVALVTAGGASARARVVTMAGLAVLGVQLVLGLLTWLVGLGADLSGGAGFGDLFGGDIGVGKVTGSFVALASLAVLAIAALLLVNVVRSLPAPARQQQQWGAPPGQQQWGPQQQWGARQQWGPQQQWGSQAGQQLGQQQWGSQAGQQPGQQQWGSQAGQQPGQQQWGSQAGQQPGQQQWGPQQQWGSQAGQQPGQQQGQWGAPAAGAAAGVAGASAWGGADSSSGPSSSGHAAGGDPGYGPPQADDDPYAEAGQSEQQQQWGDPEAGQSEQQQQWGDPEAGQSEQQQDDVSGTTEGAQPEQAAEPAVDPDATQYYGTVPEPAETEETAAPAVEPSQSSDTGTDDRDDEQRPGWWAPGS